MAQNIRKHRVNSEGIEIAPMWMCERCGLFYDSKKEAEEHERMHGRKRGKK